MVNGRRFIKKFVAFLQNLKFTFVLMEMNVLVQFLPDKSSGRSFFSDRFLLKIAQVNLVSQVLKVAFIQKVQFVFQISKSPQTIFQITILSLKFESFVYCYWREI